MAETDWTFVTGALAAGNVDRGTVQAFAPPSGGGVNVFAFHSLDSTVGVVAKYVNGTGFIPMPKGGSIRAALQRKAGLTDATPFLFMSAQGTLATSQGYLLGLAHNQEPARIVLVKGALADGLLLDHAIANSDNTYQGGEWLHIRLDVIRQPDDNVVIKCYENDLSAQAVGAAIWTPIASLETINDDAAGISFGAPYLGGYCGVGYYTKNQGRYGLVDYVQASAQI
jgi:hypothetical protein